MPREEDFCEMHYKRMIPVIIIEDISSCDNDYVEKQKRLVLDLCLNMHMEQNDMSDNYIMLFKIQMRNGTVCSTNGLIPIDEFDNEALLSEIIPCTESNFVTNTIIYLNDMLSRNKLFSNLETSPHVPLFLFLISNPELFIDAYEVIELLKCNSWYNCALENHRVIVVSQNVDELNKKLADSFLNEKNTPIDFTTLFSLEEINGDYLLRLFNDVFIMTDRQSGYYESLLKSMHMQHKDNFINLDEW